MLIEDFKHELDEIIKNRPEYIRKGQAVFNYIDERYGVARDVQFIDRCDCFYNDDIIDEFINKSFKRINK